ncbi:Oligosaccaryltransferase-domain-containing protein [Aspergillus granulosus]|uniref:Dolichyl-diphosphooligosaccharide--protein glycosyltransferase subunit 4 n=1 Tax=Aspergillus granulosus TaxID=176169 RepID=A0ABR4I5D3_9EURO
MDWHNAAAALTQVNQFTTWPSSHLQSLVSLKQRRKLLYPTDSTWHPAPRAFRGSTSESDTIDIPLLSLLARKHLTMISDNDLHRLAVFLGSCAMMLIVLYHFLEVNARDDEDETVSATKNSKADSTGTASRTTTATTGAGGSSAGGGSKDR